jgi:hypothetical protein
MVGTTAVRDEHEANGGGASELHMQLASSDAPLLRLAELNPLPRCASPPIGN